MVTRALTIIAAFAFSACAQQQDDDPVLKRYAEAGWTLLGESADGFRVFALPVSSENGRVIAWQSYLGYGDELVTKMEWDCENGRYRALSPTQNWMGSMYAVPENVGWVTLSELPADSLAIVEFEDICKNWS